MSIDHKKFKTRAQFVKVINEHFMHFQLDYATVSIGRFKLETHL